MGRAATVFGPHPFAADSKSADKAAPHCKHCRSGRDAFIHSGEARTGGATVVVTDDDGGTGVEAAATS